MDHTRLSNVIIRPAAFSIEGVITPPRHKPSFHRDGM
jgi:hypothetical protein